MVCVLIETKNPEVSVINLILFIIIIYIVISSTLINILSGLLKLRYKLRDVIFLSYVGYFKYVLLDMKGLTAHKYFFYIVFENPHLKLF